jgi:hypothetical protein
LKTETLNLVIENKELAQSSKKIDSAESLESITWDLSLKSGLENKGVKFKIFVFSDFDPLSLVTSKTSFQDPFIGLMKYEGHRLSRRPVGRFRPPSIVDCTEIGSIVLRSGDEDCAVLEF